MKNISFIIMPILMVVIALCSSSTNPPDTREKYSVLTYDGGSILNEFLVNIADEQYDKRRQIVTEALLSQKGVENYIQKITRDYRELLDMNIPVTPLNAKITEVIDCGDYRIEKVIFESQPNHHVSGNLYIPTFKKGPFPAVLEVCGHSVNGKARDTYQSVAILLALNGFAAFVIDNYGQGEMFQIRDDNGHLITLSGTVNHTQMDIGCMLTGSDILTFQILNNIRAIDYLCSRPEVDKERIGVTGNSGGGTQTLFLMGLDPRIKVAAPSCGMQTRERMFTLNGPADGCQHLPGEGMKMLEYSDYIILSSPKPVLVLAGETDHFFDINAVSKTIREAKWFYKESGNLDKLDIFTVDDGHGYHKGLREAAVWWFKKWLLNDDNTVVEPVLTIQKDEDLQVTSSGQVLNEYKKGKSITAINVETAKNFKKQRKHFWKKNSPETCLSKVKELLNYKDKDDESIIKSTTQGEIDEKVFKVKKIVITGRDGFPLPALLYIPKTGGNSFPAVIYTDSRGKHQLAEDRSRFSEMLQGDKIVLTVDLRGYGETMDDPGELRRSWRDWNNEHRIAFTSFHIGKPIIGQRVQDIIDALDYLCGIPEVDDKNVTLIGDGQAGLVALHAAAIDARVSDVKVVNSVLSWTDIIMEPLAKHHLSNIVPGAMKYYDLSDLVNSIKHRKVEFINPVDAFGNLLK